MEQSKGRKGFLGAVPPGDFVRRHLGPDEAEIRALLDRVEAESLGALIEETVPADIRLASPLDFPGEGDEHRFLKGLREVAKKNRLFRSHLGMGYYPTAVPAVIQRNILENPGWYTQYTPYQAEISQGRLEALLNFQTLVTELTGLELANASLLDEGTAAAEAMAMLHAFARSENPAAFAEGFSKALPEGAAADGKGGPGDKGGPGAKSGNRFFASETCHPQTLEVLRTRALPLGFDLVVGDPGAFSFSEEFFGALVQSPDTFGRLADLTEFCDKAHEAGIRVVVATDLLSLCLAAPPGRMGADVAVGSAQRFGVPMGYGGPHAAFFAASRLFRRYLPGRIIGVSADAEGRAALRMALQTREQHIRREKATSNICTSQVLLAIMAGMYAVYHGPEGLRAIAARTHGLAKRLAEGLEALGYRQRNAAYFDTLHLDLAPLTDKARLSAAALEARVNLRYLGNTQVTVALDELCGEAEAETLLRIFARAAGKDGALPKPGKAALPDGGAAEGGPAGGASPDWPEALLRSDPFLSHPVFHRHRSETSMLRYVKELEAKDISLAVSMIPLGSCTMKLNATSEMAAVTWPEFADLHPFVPKDQAEGYAEVFRYLEDKLGRITGLPAVSLQPNAGSQGEYAGLLVMRAFHEEAGGGGALHRNVILIPQSAHGTNPASAVMAGFRVVVVKCDEAGNIDLEDLRGKAEAHRERLGGLMLTYPSTHGVFEEEVKEVCRLVHAQGGLVYMDGANMNAQVGLCSPASMGADICHLNLHKTFCIPHGGGGPGMGPICATEALRPYLPGHATTGLGSGRSVGAVSSAPFGSALILTISYAYIRMMGGRHLTRASEVAILNANYIKKRLEEHYSILFEGKNGRVAHELILDCRRFKTLAGIEVEDIAKRLMDYGFHAPTVSFPVPGTLMIEPTESESKEEMDRFCDALIRIREEIAEVEKGEYDRTDNVLKNAPHTLEAVLSDEYRLPYGREKAAFPLNWVRRRKFWPSVARVNNAKGDKNLICTCPPLSEYGEEKMMEADLRG